MSADSQFTGNPELDAKCRAAFPSLYCAIWPDLVAVARSLGYALTIHGSLSRDLDLIACPWTDEAVPGPELAEAVRAKCEGWVAYRASTEKSMCGEKPHGRRAYTIVLNGHAIIDLSIMPRSQDADADLLARLADAQATIVAARP